MYQRTTAPNTGGKTGDGYPTQDQKGSGLLLFKYQMYRVLVIWENHETGDGSPTQN